MNDFTAIHSHGVNGVNTILSNEEEVTRLTNEYKDQDIILVTPALVAASVDVLKRAQEAYLNANDPMILGFFSEGTFGTRNKPGCQDKNEMSPLSLDKLEYYFSPVLEARSPLRVMFDPRQVEEKGNSIERTVEEITSKYPNVSLVVGHTDCTLYQALEAVQAGARGFVHYGNVNSGDIKQRLSINHPEQANMDELANRDDLELGVKDLHAKYDADSLAERVGRDDFYFELVCDGLHIHPTHILTMIEQFGYNRIVPVTDQTPGAADIVGNTFNLGISQCVVAKPSEVGYIYFGDPEQHVLLAKVNGTDTLAGSTATHRQLETNLRYWLRGEGEYAKDIGFTPLNKRETNFRLIQLFSNPITVLADNLRTDYR